MSRLTVRIGLVLFVAMLVTALLWAPHRSRAAESAAAPQSGKTQAEATPTPGSPAGSSSAPLRIAKDEFTSRKLTRTLTGEISAQDLRKLVLANGNGNVSIRGAVGPTIKLSIREELRTRTGLQETEARKLLDSIRIEIAPEGHTLGVRSVVPKFPRNIESTSINFEIQLPPTMQVETRTGNGNVVISRLAGEVRAHAGNGNLDFSNLLAALTAKGGNGQISVRNAAGPVEITNGNGNVSCLHTGQLKAHTGNGNLEAAEIAGDVNLLGGNGDITCREINGNIILDGNTGAARITQSLVLEKVRTITARKGTGEIVLTLNAAQPFTLDAKCGTGSIDSDFPVRIEGKGPAKQAGGKVGQGGPEIHLKTTTGSITIRKN